MLPLAVDLAPVDVEPALSRARAVDGRRPQVVGPVRVPLVDVSASWSELAERRADADQAIECVVRQRRVELPGLAPGAVVAEGRGHRAAGPGRDRGDLARAAPALAVVVLAVDERSVLSA